MLKVVLAFLSSCFLHNREIKANILRATLCKSQAGANTR